MADYEYVSCPKCRDKFMVGEEFFRLPQAYCIVPSAAMNFRSALPPVMQVERQINARVDQPNEADNLLLVAPFVSFRPKGEILDSSHPFGMTTRSSVAAKNIPGERRRLPRDTTTTRELIPTAAGNRRRKSPSIAVFLSKI